MLFYWDRNQATRLSRPDLASQCCLTGHIPAFSTFKSSGWLGAFSAFMFADLVTGNSLLQSLFLTLSNLISTIVSIFFIRYFKINYKYYNTGYTFGSGLSQNQGYAVSV